MVELTLLVCMLGSDECWERRTARQYLAAATCEMEGRRLQEMSVEDAVEAGFEIESFSCRRSGE